MEIDYESKWIRKKPVPKIKTKSVKECLQPQLMTRFQELVTEIRNNLIIKGDQKEIGKASKQILNLPASIDPIWTTFGFSRRYPFSAAEIISSERLHYLNCDSRCTPNPGEQIDRKYEKPFSKYKSFGKSTNADSRGSRAKRLIYWYKESADFQTNDHKSEKFSIYQDLQNKQIDPNFTSIHESLREVPINAKIKQMKRCLSHINSIRLQTKKRDSEISFFDLKDHFNCIDKSNSKTIKLNIFYDVLKKARIKPEKEMFEFFLKEFNLIKEDFVCYEEALNLLNWRYEFPSIAKIHDLPGEYQYYTTTYQDSMIYYKT